MADWGTVQVSRAAQRSTSRLTQRARVKPTVRARGDLPRLEPVQIKLGHVAVGRLSGFRECEGVARGGKVG